MAQANRFHDKAHARIYQDWLRLPAWLNLSPPATKLLVAILAQHRPGLNGTYEIGARDAGRWIGRGKDAGARALTELESFGWLTVERTASFATKNRKARYALTCYANDAAGLPASHAYRDWSGAPQSR